MKQSGFYHPTTLQVNSRPTRTAVVPQARQAGLPVPSLKELKKNKWLMFGALGAGFFLLKSGKGIMAFGAGVAAGYYGKKYLDGIMPAVNPKINDQ